MTRDSEPLPRETNKDHQRAKKQPRQGPSFGLDRDGVKFDRSFELYTATAPAERLVVFQHIRKTAGTSLRQVIHSNFTNAGASHRILGAPDANDPALTREWCSRLIASLDQDERDSLVCVVSHFANHLMYQLGRPAVALTFLRDPVDRVMSDYGFTRGQRPFQLEDLYSPDGAEPPGGRLHWFNGQSRSLLEPFLGTELPELGWSHGPPADADVWRERLFSLLEDHYLVGTQDRFDESVRYFAAELGWDRVFAPRAKASKREAPVLSDSLRSSIVEYNWLDQELYDRYSRVPIGAKP
jgi:hypothetical protein